MGAPACLHLLCGKAGAGKSTLSRSLAAEHRAILICEDVWLARLFGEEMKTFDDYRQYAQRARTVVGPLVIDLLAAGQNVVLDYPANTRAARAWLRSLFEAAGSDHMLHFIDVPDAICLQHIDRRNTERPEGSHHLTPDDFAAISSFFEAPDAAEGFSLQVHGAGESAAPIPIGHLIARPTLTVHEAPPAVDAALVDAGLDASNLAAAPLHEVRRLSCFARLEDGLTIGGAIGRTWGTCCELQQLWVAPAHRRRGLGARLVREFHRAAEARGCRTFYLETFSFQAPGLYAALGYEAKVTIEGFAPGIGKMVMVREVEKPHRGG